MLKPGIRDPTASSYAAWNMPFFLDAFFLLLESILSTKTLILIINKTLKSKDVFFKSACRWQVALHTSPLSLYLLEFIFFWYCINWSLIVLSGEIYRLILLLVSFQFIDMYLKYHTLYYYKQEFFLGDLGFHFAFRILITISVQLYLLHWK